MIIQIANNYNKIISYTALNKIILTTSANVNISSFIDLAINNGANRIDGIEFITSKKVIDENFNNLLKEAFDNAKQRAETLSMQGGFLINGVKTIDIPQNNGNYQPHLLQLMHLTKVLYKNLIFTNTDIPARK